MRLKMAGNVVLFNYSSFGSGLKQGPLAICQFNQFMGFENKPVVATLDGNDLKQILARANRHQKNEFDKPGGDFVFAYDINPEPDRYYKMVTGEGGAFPENQLNYLSRPVGFQPMADLTIKRLLPIALTNQ
jgi:2',3'-cyclic-nucleotide 2'-phosphodiesterase (5'-nucleotidase family)